MAGEIAGHPARAADASQDPHPDPDVDPDLSAAPASGGEVRCSIGPHDLLRLAGAPDWPAAPPWVAQALRETPVVVVRRAAAPSGTVAVGVRGPTRAHRYAGLIDRAIIGTVTTPEQLSAVRPASARARNIAALAALPPVRDFLASLGLAWGPTGSVAFELATGAAAATPASDLDLLVRVPRPLPSDVAHAIGAGLAEIAGRAGTRIDAQLETPRGAVALQEYVRAQARVLLRTDAGPLMVADPWAPAAAPRRAPRP